MNKLFLDDIRDPPFGFIVVRSYQEFVSHIESEGVPYFISFDHDLGQDQPSGLDCVKYLVDRGLPLPVGGWVVHSANPPGAANIAGLLKSYARHLSSNLS